MVVQGRNGDPDATGDVADGRAVEADLIEEIARGSQDG
jgi:hypothetical protein